MRTNFTEAQRADPEIRESDAILRACVHCGFCTSACPTYRLTGDELDGPRGRIWLIRDLLEGEGPPSAEVVRHLDRCLSCLACMPACPSGVHYQHLIDHARAEIERRYRRPVADRLFRAVIAGLLVRPAWFRRALVLGRAARGLRRLVPGRLRAALDLAAAAPRTADDAVRPGVHPASGARRRRVAMIGGCVQAALGARIDAAAIRLLNRAGCEVVVAGVGCCGAIPHHLGRAAAARDLVRRTVAALDAEIADGGLDAVVQTASGCGTMMKDYGFLMREDPDWAAPARRVAERTRDLSEVLAELDLSFGAAPPLRVAWQAPCSLRHGQKVTAPPVKLLARAGFDVAEPEDAGICCGSAGSYNLLEPRFAEALGADKAARLAELAPDLVVSSNLGCMVQLRGRLGVPVAHLAEALDWASGGPPPPGLGPRRG